MAKCVYLLHHNFTNGNSINNNLCGTENLLCSTNNFNGDFNNDSASVLSTTSAAPVITSTIPTTFVAPILKVGTTSDEPTVAATSTTPAAASTELASLHPSQKVQAGSLKR